MEAIPIRTFYIGKKLCIRGESVDVTKDEFEAFKNSFAKNKQEEMRAKNIHSSDTTSKPIKDEEEN